MISCEQAGKMFYEYMDKELTPEDVKRLEEHLKQCADCSGHLDFDKTLREFVRKQSAKSELPPSLKNSIFKKLKEL